jgi:hypothetical protein
MEEESEGKRKGHEHFPKMVRNPVPDPWDARSMVRPKLFLFIMSSLFFFFFSFPFSLLFAFWGLGFSAWK